MTECLSNGTWSNVKPICTMIGCGPLSNPANGFVYMPDGTDVGARATYSCKPGFRPSHSNGRNCAVGNQWTGKEPTCDVRSKYLISL
jgi:CUB/sushi domain-containing protein